MLPRLTRPSVRALPLLAAGVLATAACTGAEDRRPAVPTAETTKAERPGKVLDERWRGTSSLKDPRVVRMWATDETVVVITRGGIQGFDAATGETRWELPGPSSAAEGAPCAASAGVNDQGVGAVLYDRGFERYGDFGGCGVLVAMDTADGKVRWRAELANRDGAQADYGDVPEDAVTIGDEVIGARAKHEAPPGEDIRRFSLDGTELRPLRAPGGEDCRQYATWVQSTEYALAQNTCAGTPRLSLFRTRSGEELWTRSRPRDMDRASGIAATEPFTIAAGRRLVSFGGDGDVLAEAEVPGIVGSGPRWSDDSVLATSTGDEPQDAGFAGVDLRTGKPLWQEAVRYGVPAGADGGDLLAVYLEEQRHRLLRLDGRDGTRTEEGVIPREISALVPAGEVPDVAVAGDTLYVSAGRRLVAYRLP